MVQTFAAYIHSLPDPQEYPEIMEGLPQARREKIMNHKTVEGRKQSLGAGLLLKQVLEKYGISPEMVGTDKNGKPMVRCAGRYAEGENSADECAAVNGEGVRPDKCIEKLAQNLPQLCFNLSHSGNLVVCAVSEKEVGCDAEKIGPARMKVAKRFFSEWENRYLGNFELSEKDVYMLNQPEPSEKEPDKSAQPEPSEKEPDKSAQPELSKKESDKSEQPEPSEKELDKSEKTEPSKKEICMPGQSETSERKAYMLKRSEADREKNLDREFCRLWTIREAYIKMTGEGMRLDFRKFEVRPELECLTGSEQPEYLTGEEQPERTADGECSEGETGGPQTEHAARERKLEWKKNSLCIFREGIKEVCHIQEYEIEDYCISVCAWEAEFAESINWVEL